MISDPTILCGNKLDGLLKILIDQKTCNIDEVLIRSSVDSNDHARQYHRRWSQIPQQKGSRLPDYYGLASADGMLCADLKMFRSHFHISAHLSACDGGVMVSIVAFQAVDPGSIPGHRT
ncbi:hypothetical protein J6590_006644 [Homalodisca vitripennis]|nr:hypothetical protein J6590_006644 [Homalodisca vitripennis]